MPKKHELETDLREMIEQGHVVAVVGSGVSCATTTRALTWRGLIESAVARCKTIGAPSDWCGHVTHLLGSPYADMLLAAAEMVHQKLCEDGGGEFARWLRETSENIQPENRSIIESLAALNIPLLTTNYDDLIEKVTGLKHVSWMDARNVARVVRGQDSRVLHLHGYWDEPDSVVLGIRSYEAIKNHEHTKTIMKAFAVTKSLMFVGCGDEGLADPNFGNFLTWLEALEKEAGVEHRHYRLVRKRDVFKPRGRLFPLPYGEDYDELPEFLESLRPQKKTAVRVLVALPNNIDYYLTCLAQDTAHLKLIGMGRSLQVELPIDEAYVPLRTTMARSLERRKPLRFKAGCAEYEEDVDLGEVFRKAAELRLRGVVLLGEPGSGKTTGARQLAWRLASRQRLPEDLGLPAGITPVFLRFRNLSRAALSEENGLRTFLVEETRCAVAPDGLDAPGADLWNGKGGGLLWILDGLDEVIDPGARQKVSGWVTRALNKRPKDWFLVTCRFQGYYHEGVPLGPQFVEFHIRPLSDEQQERFVRDWFHAAYGKLLGAGPRAEARSQADSDELLNILSLPEYQAGHIRELCTNPLLLTILCIVFHEERKLPTGRAELFAHCVRVLLEYWRRDLYKSDLLGTELKPYDAEAAQAVLARVAWWMHQQQDRTAASLDELAEEAAKGLAEVAPSSGRGRDGHGFVARMLDETGILAMAGEGEGRCGFLHLSFQESLAAEHAAREGLAGALASRAAESWWREVALLSLRRSRSFCEAFFGEMIKAGIAENCPDLAQRCLEESLYFVPNPFLEALQRPRPEESNLRHAHDARVAAILRLLRDRADQVPELEKISRGLVQSEASETRGFAFEILARGHVVSKAEMQKDGVFVDERRGMTFVMIPPGKFPMGSENGGAEEKPVHTVRILQGFGLGKYPVTNAQYGRFLEMAGSSVRKPQTWNDRRFNQPEQPVVDVSWHEARAFCEWAGGRLPTEAEWEYACRAGTTREYSFGDDLKLLDEYGWYDQNSHGQTQPVGAKKPNPWGLHDMMGNVWEWCSSKYERYPYRSDDGRESTEGDELRVVRGGSFSDYPRLVRCAFRSYLVRPGDRLVVLGFRVVVVSPGSRF